MENQIFKLKPVGRMGPLRLGADYMQDVNKRAKLIEDALKTVPKGDKQLRLPLGKIG